MTELTPYHHNKPTRRTDWGAGLVDDFFRTPWFSGRLSYDTFRMDVRETDKEYRIEADLPGVKKEDVDLSMDNGRLTISIQSSGDTEESQEGYVYRERHSDWMQRTVQLPDVSAEGVQAKLENGVSILVPPHIEAGTRVVVDTATGEYVERAKD